MIIASVQGKEGRGVGGSYRCVCSHSKTNLLKKAITVCLVFVRYDDDYKCVAEGGVAVK